MNILFILRYQQPPCVAQITGGTNVLNRDALLSLSRFNSTLFKSVRILLLTMVDHRFSSRSIHLCRNSSTYLYMDKNGSKMFPSVMYRGDAFLISHQLKFPLTYSNSRRKKRTMEQKQYVELIIQFKHLKEFKNYLSIEITSEIHQRHKLGPLRYK